MRSSMRPGPVRAASLVLALLIVWTALSVPARAAGISEFVGEYVGSADMVRADGSLERRDMSVKIQETRDGFNVTWQSVSYKPDGRQKEANYTIDFLPTDRDGIFSAAMRRNVFGHAVQMDPMKGEPFVWGRIAGDTLTVYSLFVAEDGGYELQQYDRTLTVNGLKLDFSRIINGDRARSVETLLEKQ